MPWLLSYMYHFSLPFLFFFFNPHALKCSNKERDVTNEKKGKEYLSLGLHFYLPLEHSHPVLQMVYVGRF